MAMNYSRELKAVVVPENFLDNPLNILKENCLVVQHFDYDCIRKRNQSNQVYGAMEPVMLKFSVRVNSSAHSRVFYQNLVRNDHTDYSFLFNVNYNQNDRISDYEDGMLVDAYVVSVEEEYSSDTDESGLDRQIILNVVLKVCSVTYLGREEQNNVKNVFI